MVYNTNTEGKEVCGYTPEANQLSDAFEVLVRDFVSDTMDNSSFSTAEIAYLLHSALTDCILLKKLERTA